MRSTGRRITQHLGAAYWKSGDLPRALTAFEEALTLDPEETSSLLAASELAHLMGDQDKHRRYLRRAQRFGAEEVTLKFGDLLREFGQQTQGNDDISWHDREIAVMNSVIRLNPGDAYAYLRRGLAYFAKGDGDLAMADLDLVLEWEPDNEVAYIFRGTLFGNRKQWDRLADGISTA